MANKKEINPNTGIRLKELIKDLKMTQGEFGERIGLESQQISCIVRGVRRLTEDNARRIAELFPPVRMEWLMGWDDYKTVTRYKAECIHTELHNKYGNELWLGHTNEIVEMLAIFGYSIGYIDDFDNDLFTAMKIKRVLENNSNLFESLGLMEKIYSLIDEKAGTAFLNHYLGEFQISDAEEEEFASEIVDNEEKYKAEYLKAVESMNELEKLCYKDKSPAYSLVDKNSGEELEITYSEIRNFSDRLYDVITVYIRDFITQKKLKISDNKKKGQA